MSTQDSFICLAFHTCLKEALYVFQCINVFSEQECNIQTGDLHYIKGLLRYQDTFFCKIIQLTRSTASSHQAESRKQRKYELKPS